MDVPQGPPNLAGTSLRFASLHARRRYPAPTSSQGLEVQGAPTDTPVWVHAWPESGQTLERLPQGLEGRDVVGGTASATVGGTAELATADERTAAEGAPTLPDSVVLGGVEYEVVASGPRRVGPGGVVTWQTFIAARVQR
jgi:hypothetical protein